jgi:hypothetical protein
MKKNILTLIIFLVIVLIVIGSYSFVKTQKVEMLEGDKTVELEDEMEEIKKELEAVKSGDNEDMLIATIEEVTVWIDHFIVREEGYKVGSKANVHVHIRRRDKLNEQWNGSIKVTFDDKVIERNTTQKKN